MPAYQLSLVEDTNAIIQLVSPTHFFHLSNLEGILVTGTMMMFEIQWIHDDHLKLHSDCFLLVVIEKKEQKHRN